MMCDPSWFSSTIYFDSALSQAVQTLNKLKKPCSWEKRTLMQESMFQFWNIWRWVQGSVIYGTPKECFVPHMSWNLLFDSASSVLISVKTVVGNFPQPISGRCCVGVSFLPLLWFSLLLKQEHWRKRMEFQLKCVYLFSLKFILRKTADLPDCILHRVLSRDSGKLACYHNAIPQTLRGELACGSFQLYIWRLLSLSLYFLMRQTLK